MTAYLHKRHFSLIEARNLLKTVRNQCGRLVELKSQLNELNYDIYKHAYFGGLGPNGAKFHPRELEELIDIVRDFEERGILIKSIEDGLIDFPSLRASGEEVYLCWKFNEEDILFWHTIEEGFNGRQPVEVL
ncbi:MAG: DUF2203 domain-containing protein [Bacteroidetes bacterium]|nr:DUF2203 domain-containing protein [Bacteroidota bacterium]